MLFVCFTFTTAGATSAQSNTATSTKKTFFQNIILGPKNLFNKIFTAKNHTLAPQIKTEIVAPVESAGTLSKPELAATLVSSVKSKEKKTPEQRQVPQRAAADNPQKPQPVVPEAVTIAAPSGNAQLRLSVVSGGNVFSLENKISCYSNDVCNATFPVGKKILLKAEAIPGYVFKGWSEAECGTQKECTLTMRENMVLSAYFEVAKQEKNRGKILSPRSGSTCHIPIGEDDCEVMVLWQSTMGLDMTMRVDEKEYYLALEDPKSFPRLSGADPDDIRTAESQNASGPVYFYFFAGDHRIVISDRRSGELDSVKIGVECAPGLYWNGVKCWEKDARMLFVFKNEHAAIISEPGNIRCGYNPERCSYGFSNNAKVSLKVMVDDGYVFEGWTGGCTGKELTCVITMDSDKGVGIKLK